MKRFFCMLAVLAVMFTAAVPVFADDASSSASSSAASSAAGVGRSSVMDGAQGVLGDANSAINGIYDNLPEQSGGLLDFIIACQSTLWPAWFIWAICASLIFTIVNMFLRFLWSGK